MRGHSSTRRSPIVPHTGLAGTGGGTWHEAGSVAQWTIETREVSMSGILGLFGGKLIATDYGGAEVMDSTKTTNANWEPDYTRPILFISLIALAIGLGCFPIELPSWFIRLFTKKGDTVLNPFVGIGTTAMAALLLGRRYIGIIASPEYVREATTNIEELERILDSASID